MKRQQIWTLVILAIAVFVAGCSQRQEYVRDTRSVSEVALPTSTVMHSTSTIAQLEAIKLTIREVKTITAVCDNNQFLQAEPGYKFIAVDVTTENIGNEEEFVSVGLYKLIDENGYRYGYDKVSFCHTNTVTTTKLQPTEKISMVIVFAVPNSVNTNTLKLKFDRGY